MAKPYVLTQRIPIPPSQHMGRSTHLRDDRARWHILDEESLPICRRQSNIGELATFADVVTRRGRICNPCHGEFSWAESPLDFRVEDRGYETPCHVWLRALTGHGYAARVEHGTRGIRGRKVTRVHREVYAAAHGEIPDGIDIHHLCGQKDCVRLEHLEAMSRSEHLRFHRDPRRTA